MKQPNFFIIGAPKCGTTSLAHWLGQHPQIFMSPVKEPHFYSTDLGIGSYSSRDRYLRLFQNAGAQHLRVGEASTWYLYSDVAVSNILEDNPNAKFIVCVRNPVEMVVSLYNQHRLVQNEDINTFEEAWYAQELRCEGRCIPKNCQNVRMLFYGEVCKIGNQLRSLLEIVDCRNTIFIFQEDMRNSGSVLWEEITRFLGVSCVETEGIPRKNAASQNRFPIIRRAVRRIHQMKSRYQLPAFNTGLTMLINELNKKNSPSIRVDDKFMRDVLYPHFREDIKILEEVTGRDLSHWC